MKYVLMLAVALLALQGCNKAGHLPPEKPSMAAEDAPKITLPKPATQTTINRQKELLASMPKNMSQDIEFAQRGFIATSPQNVIERLDGKGVSYDLTQNDFIKDDAPDTVNPLLWRHGKIMGYEGLFEVTKGVYQVRGFDVDNITFIEGENGFIVIDPMTAAEPAAAAYALVKKYVADKPVFAVIYTHSHADHFAGIEGVIDRADVEAGKVQIIAPKGFLAETVSEWMIAGNAMGRRAFYQFGLFLPPGKRGNVGVGTGPGIALGKVDLIPPTHEISNTGEKLVIEGVEFIFQLTPGAEAPVEMNFYLPQFKSLCMAETAIGTIHNVQTLRGANVRDAKAWADYLTEAEDLFGQEAESLFVSHLWPHFGNDHIREYLTKHRDTYKYMHDQTVRMMNAGLTPDEISETLILPDSLNSEWYNRGFYGSVSHNVKGIYDKYMGWYNGIPADLNRHPPIERAKKYVAGFGGMDSLMKSAENSYKDGDYRWASEILQHAVFAQPDHKNARELLADSYEQLGYVAESSIWRNIYLTAARELRQGGPDIYKGGSEDYILGGSTDEQVLDLLTVRLLPEKAAEKSLSMNIVFRETGNKFNLALNNSVLLYRKNVTREHSPTLTVSREGFLAVAFGFMTLDQAVGAGMIEIKGDGFSFTELSSMMENPSLDFNIIEP